MQTRLSAEFAGTPEGTEAEAILRKCVHCGFCNATCPTYQLLGDELDGPRGRIYLIKEMLEGHAVTERTQRHLDRCLTCRNCETTCPSGVRYGHLVEIGRHLVEQRVERRLPARTGRWLLKEGLTSSLFGPALEIGRKLRPLLPAALRDKLSPAPARAGPELQEFESREHRRKVLLLGGCVQPAMRPGIHRATRRVLDAAGIQALFATGEGCCGALRTHLADRDGGLRDMRRNIDAWWPMVSSGLVESIVVNASGCSQMVKEYAHALRGEPAYAERAARIVSMTRDLGELLPELALALKGRVRAEGAPRLAFHSPCTLQHGQRISGIDAQLRALGFDVRQGAEAHLCCGSAGTYSVLEPGIANALRDRKLASFSAVEPECIVSANIGCIQHLASGTATPVKHWIEVLDEALSERAAETR
jgi:glycolate oxidase iron-sulfur subunit